MKKLWLSPEEKIRLAMEMTEAVTAICAEGIRAQNPGMTEGGGSRRVAQTNQERRP